MNLFSCLVLMMLSLPVLYGQSNSLFGVPLQPGSPFQPPSTLPQDDGPTFKKMREVDAEFDLAKIGGIGRSETNALSQKIWTQFRQTHDFDGHSVFTDAEQGGCPDTPAARLAFAHYVKAQKPFIKFVDLQNCPKPGCVKGSIETNINGFASSIPCPTCEGTGKLGNVYNYTMLYSAELAPLPSPAKSAGPVEKVALSPLAAFCAAHTFVPMRRPQPDGSEVILGKVDMEHASSGVSFAMKIIDTSEARGGSSYYAVIRLLDADMVTLAEVSGVYLPVRGGILKLPLAKFSPRRGQFVGASAEAQLNVLKNTYGIRVEYDKFVGGEGLITTSVSVLTAKPTK